MKHLSPEQIQMLINESEGLDSLMRHVEQCMECRGAYESMLDVHQSLSQLSYEKPSMRFAKNIYEIIVRKQELELQETRWTKIIQSILFSSVFLILILGFYYFFNNRKEIYISEDSLSTYYEWSLIIILSTMVLWILHAIDLRFSKKV